MEQPRGEKKIVKKKKEKNMSRIKSEITCLHPWRLKRDVACHQYCPQNMQIRNSLGFICFCHWRLICFFFFFCMHELHDTISASCWIVLLFKASFRCKQLIVTSDLLFSSIWECQKWGPITSWNWVFTYEIVFQQIFPPKKKRFFQNIHKKKTQIRQAHS